MDVRRIAFVGAGYVGGPTAAVFALHCPDVAVTVVDRDAGRIDAWLRGPSPVREPGLDEIVAACCAARSGASGKRDASGSYREVAKTSVAQPPDGGLVAANTTANSNTATTSGKPGVHNLFFSTDVQGAVRDADVVFVAVNTPLCEATGGHDTAHLDGAAAWIAAVCNAAPSDRKVVVTKSTVPVGTAHRLHKFFGSCRTRVSVVANPEFLAEGTAIADLLAPARVVLGGADADAVAALAALYARWVPRARILTMSAASAEVCKLASNAMLAQRLSAVHTLAALCEASPGASLSDVMLAVGADPRIGGAFLRPSPGWGGSCLRKDTLGLASCLDAAGHSLCASFWRASVGVNAWQTDAVAARILAALGRDVLRPRILLLGFAFKADTADVRDTSAAALVSLLLARDAAVAVHDPHVAHEALLASLAALGVDGRRVSFFSGSVPHAAADAHCVVLVTDHAAYRDSVDWGAVCDAMAPPRAVFDCRGVLDASALRALGLSVRVTGVHS